MLWASPTVVNGVVYVGTTLTTTSMLWMPTQARSLEVRNRNGLIPRQRWPMVWSTSGSDDHSVYALDASTGALLWKYATGSDTSFLRQRWLTAWFMSGSSDHNLYALNASTGALIWKYPTGRAIYCLAGGGQRRGLCRSADRGQYSPDAGTGVCCGSTQPGGCDFSSPAVANGVVYIGSWDHNLYALKANTGALLWKYTTGSGSRVPRRRWSTAWYTSVPTTGTCYAFGLPDQQMSEKFSPPERPDPALLTPDWSLQPSSAVTPPLKK